MRDFSQPKKYLCRNQLELMWTLLLWTSEISSRRMLAHSLGCCTGIQGSSQRSYDMIFKISPKHQNSLTLFEDSEEYMQRTHIQGHLIMPHLRSRYLLCMHIPRLFIYSLNISIVQKFPFKKMLTLNKL